MASAGNVLAPIAPGPAVSAFAIVKSDVTIISPPTRFLYVGGVGDLAVILDSDTVAVVFSAVPGGTVLPICVARVMATGTTATLILGLR